MDDFNPGLHNLVFLGNNFLQALEAVTKAADVYFDAIRKFGEQALQTASCNILGQVLVQISDTQQSLNSDMESAFQRFHGDLLQEMEKNMKLDMQFINGSRQRYEKEYRYRVATLEKRKTELWRMERNHDRNVREMQDKVSQLHMDLQMFLSESYKAAQTEERRRYRFLAEKHWLLSHTALQFFNRATGVLQNRISVWKEHTDSTRTTHNNTSNTLSPSHSSGYQSGRTTPVGKNFDMMQRPGDSNANIRRSFNSIPQAVEYERAEHKHPEADRRSLVTNSSFASSSDIHLSRSNSLGDSMDAADGSRVQAVVSHNPGNNRTLLPFGKGDVIHVLVPEAKNGWLFGKLEGTNTQGWFPEAYVQPLQERRPHQEPPQRGFPLRGTQSTGDLLDHSGSLTPKLEHNKTSVPPAPPVPSSGQFNSGSSAASVRSRSGSVTSLASNATSEARKSGLEPPRELFPRGTNPFATVKLRPTVTNDRSAPLIR